MNYVNYSRRVREYNPDASQLIDLCSYCHTHGIAYYVMTESPTQFELDEGSKHVFVNYPKKSVTLPISADLASTRPEEVLEFLSYVARCYDARETIAHLHRLQNASLDV